jgi:4-diphosphocytidyl-2-C-methyl-D-erythritol kinase
MRRLAPAKVNLYLHVGPPATDGYHPIDSLMVFADVGDYVSMTDGDDAGLVVTGPFAEGLATEPTANLVVRARDRLLRERPGYTGRPGLELDKRLPIASGLGGGSADAAATLELLRQGLGLDLSDGLLAEIGLDLGSDVPACLRGRAVVATGRGEHLREPLAFPSLPAVLVNPGAPSPTGDVYRAYDQAICPAGADAPTWPKHLATPDDMAGFLATCRNDLQAPAVALQPVIGDVLAVLAGRPETRLARMSGSGATCFALCATPADASGLADRLAAAHPSWWVVACRLGGSPG